MAPPRCAEVWLSHPPNFRGVFLCIAQVFLHRAHRRVLPVLPIFFEVMLSGRERFCAYAVLVGVRSVSLCVMGVVCFNH